MWKQKNFLHKFPSRRSFIHRINR